MEDHLQMPILDYKKPCICDVVFAYTLKFYFKAVSTYSFAVNLLAPNHVSSQLHLQTIQCEAFVSCLNRQALRESLQALHQEAVGPASNPKNPKHDQGNEHL